MGKLNIAHHKSYHPYRRDNIERVRRDEEEAKLKEEKEEGRMMLAVRMNSDLTLLDTQFMFRTQKLVWIFSESELVRQSPLRRRVKDGRTKMI